MHRTLRYDLSKFLDCKDKEGRKIMAFTIKTTDGTDEAYASRRAEAKGSGMTEELIRYSLQAYEVADGENIKTVDIKQPFEDFDHWTTKARNFVVGAWKKLSTPDETEIKDFFASATEIE